ncbi:DUF1989 domain-containing protein, partial [Mariprofundus ferrooxydans]
MTGLTESTFDPAQAVFRETVPAGEPFIRVVKKGEVFRILDLEGNQAVDTLFYNAENPDERYSATNTISSQGNIYLS